MRQVRILIGCALLSSAFDWGHGHGQERLKISYSSIDAPNANEVIKKLQALQDKYSDLGVFAQVIDSKDAKAIKATPVKAVRGSTKVAFAKG